MDRSVLGRFSCTLVAVLCFSTASGAEDWEPVAGGLGRDASRFAVHLGGSYGTMQGSELENLDPSTGFDVGVSFRFLGNLSAVGYYAADKANVSGQLTQLLDQRVRADGRSGLVEGEVKTERFRAGLRVDAYRERGWRFTPYLLGAVVFSDIEVTIDSVDGAPPAPIPSADPLQPRTDISTVKSNEIGGLGRLGVEYRVASRIAVDLNGNVEIIEAQPGTNTIFAVNSGLVVRF